MFFVEFLFVGFFFVLSPAVRSRTPPSAHPPVRSRNPPVRSRTRPPSRPAAHPRVAPPPRPRTRPAARPASHFNPPPVRPVSRQEFSGQKFPGKSFPDKSFRTKVSGQEFSGQEFSGQEFPEKSWLKEGSKKAQVRPPPQAQKRLNVCWLKIYGSGAALAQNLW